MRKFTVTVNGKSYEVEVEEKRQLNGKPAVEQHQPVQVVQQVKQLTPVQPVRPAEQPKQEIKTPAVGPEAESNGVSITAPMPGTVLDIKVNVEDNVTRGQVLIILEAMKMENEIVAPRDGRVISVRAVKGSPVNAGDVLVAMA